MLFPLTRICGIEVLVEPYYPSVVLGINVSISETWMSKFSCLQCFVLIVNYCTVDIKHKNWHQSNDVLQVGGGGEKLAFLKLPFFFLLFCLLCQCITPVVGKYWLVFTCVCIIFGFVEGLNVSIRFKTRMKCCFF